MRSLQRKPFASFDAERQPTRKSQVESQKYKVRERRWIEAIRLPLFSIIPLRIHLSLRISSPSCLFPIVKFHQPTSRFFLQACLKNLKCNASLSCEERIAWGLTVAPVYREQEFIEIMRQIYRLGSEGSFERVFGSDNGCGGDGRGSGASSIANTSRGGSEKQSLSDDEAASVLLSIFTDSASAKNSATSA